MKYFTCFQSLFSIFFLFFTYSCECFETEQEMQTKALFIHDSRLLEHFSLAVVLGCFGVIKKELFLCVCFSPFCGSCVGVHTQAALAQRYMYKCSWSHVSVSEIGKMNLNMLAIEYPVSGRTPLLATYCVTLPDVEEGSHWFDLSLHVCVFVRGFVWATTRFNATSEGLVFRRGSGAGRLDEWLCENLMCVLTVCLTDNRALRAETKPNLAGLKLLNTACSLWSQMSVRATTLCERESRESCQCITVHCMSNTKWYVLNIFKFASPVAF